MIWIKVKKIKLKDFEKEIEKRKNRRLIAISGVDEDKNFSVYYHFDDEKDVENLKVDLPKDKPRIPTVVFDFPSAELYERETHDFFGIEFEGNPRLHEKLFLPEDFKGKPPLLKKGEDSYA